MSAMPAVAGAGPQPSDTLVSVRHLTKRFPVTTTLFGRPAGFLSAVDDVSLAVGRGETLGLVGESGSGKSTLARLLLRLIPATSGEVYFDGVNVLTVSRRDLAALRQKMQIVFQDPFGSLDPRMKVGTIIGEGLYHSGTSASEKRRRIAELIDLVGLPAQSVQLYSHEFSGGQRQRISIARALAADPRFLIADEPVSALDVSVQGQILNLMRDLQKQLGLTYLFISHDLSVVRHVADRVAVMYLGKVVEVAGKHELFHNPRHPYTQALLSAVPVTQGERPQRIILTGDIPSPIDPPRRCRFAERCFRSIDMCRQQVPPLEPAAGDAVHLVACFNHAPFAEARASRAQ
jgi:oligopeptide/dipeptide ABC transporter ATP-binding protein